MFQLRLPDGKEMGTPKFEAETLRAADALQAAPLSDESEKASKLLLARLLFFHIRPTVRKDDLVAVHLVKQHKAVELI